MRGRVFEAFAGMPQGVWYQSHLKPKPLKLPSARMGAAT